MPIKNMATTAHEVEQIKYLIGNFMKEYKKNAGTPNSQLAGIGMAIGTNGNLAEIGILNMNTMILLSDKDEKTKKKLLTMLERYVKSKKMKLKIVKL